MQFKLNANFTEPSPWNEYIVFGFNQKMKLSCLWQVNMHVLFDIQSSKVIENTVKIIVHF